MRLSWCVLGLRAVRSLIDTKLVFLVLFMRRRRNSGRRRRRIRRGREWKILIRKSRVQTTPLTLNSSGWTASLSLWTHGEHLNLNGPIMKASSPSAFGGEPLEYQPRIPRMAISIWFACVFVWLQKLEICQLVPRFPRMERWLRNRALIFDWLFLLKGTRGRQMKEGDSKEMEKTNYWKEINKC